MINKKFSSIMFFLISMLGSIVVWMYLLHVFEKDMNFIIYLSMLLGIYILYFISIISHEGGHLICGLLSDYKYSSFRVYNIMLIKIRDKLRLKKYSLAGTAGQCIMIPPKTDNPPFILYNLGGVLMNLLLSIIGLVLFLIISNIYLKAIFFVFMVLNIMMLLTNGIPFDTGVPNDMLNILEFSKNKNSYQQFLNSLYMQELIINGTRPRDIDKEYIFCPKKIESIGDANNMATYCGKLLDSHKFEKDVEEIKNLLDNKYLLLIYKAILLNDMKYCYIVLDKDLNEINNLYDKKINNVLKQMNSYPSVIRTNYAEALLVHKDNKKAASLLNMFNKLEKTYPYLGDYLSEKELIKIVTDKNVAK